MTQFDIYKFIKEVNGHVTLKTLENYFPKTPREILTKGISLWLGRDAK